VTVRPIDPATATQGTLEARALHANAGRWLVCGEVRASIGEQAADPTLTSKRLLSLVRQGAAEKRPGTRRKGYAKPPFEYRFVTWPEMKTSAAPEAREARRASTVTARQASATATADQICAHLARHPHKQFSLDQLRSALGLKNQVNVADALALLTWEDARLLVIHGTSRSVATTRYQHLQSFLPQVPATPLTRTATRVLNRLRHHSARQTSSTPDTLAQEMKLTPDTVRSALALLDAHGLLTLRAVGAMVLFRTPLDPAPTAAQHPKDAA
jgi:DNA-binding transcriptional ArsR family regulator